MKRITATGRLSPSPAAVRSERRPPGPPVTPVVVCPLGAPTSGFCLVPFMVFGLFGPLMMAPLRGLVRAIANRLGGSGAARAKTNCVSKIC
jgi:hypothetical protein